MDKRIYTMESERPVKAVLSMGIPVTIGMMFMVLYNIVDTYFIGMLDDTNQLAAVNLSYPVMMVLIAVSGIAGNGGASYIARCLGAGKKEKAEHTLTIGLDLIAAGSIVIGVPGIIFAGPVVNLLGADSDTFEYTKEYVLILLAGNIFIMGNYAMGQLLRSEGSTFYSMVGMVAGTVFNILLDPVFIFSFNMELKGAALATVISNLISILIYCWYYVRKKTILLPRASYIRIEGEILKEIMWVGIPHTLEQFLAAASMIVVNNLAAAYGASAVAAMGIANKIMSFGNYIYQGMAAGCQPLMGYTYGAGNYDRLKDIIKAGIKVITSIEIGVMIIFGILAPYLIGLFSEDESVILLGSQTLRAFMLMLPFVGTVSLVRNAFNSMGKPMFAFGITIVRQLVLYIPFMIVFNRLWGYSGLIHAQPVEEAICMVLAAVLLFKYIGRLKNNIS